MACLRGVSFVGVIRMLGKKILLSLKEVSVLVDLSLRTTTKLVASGELKSIRVGRRRLVHRDG